MYQVGDRVLYGIHGVCRIVALQMRTVDRKKAEYFVLEPADQSESRFYVPTGNPAAVAKLRPMISAQELEALLRSDAVHQNVWIADEGQRKLRYRELIGSGDRAALLSMVHCLHENRRSQLAQGKKFHLCDENFLRDAQKLLTGEFSQILGLDAAQTESYVRKVMEME